MLSKTLTDQKIVPIVTKSRASWCTDYIIIGNVYKIAKWPAIIMMSLRLARAGGPDLEAGFSSLRRYLDVLKGIYIGAIFLVNLKLATTASIEPVLMGVQLIF